MRELFFKKQEAHVVNHSVCLFKSKILFVAKRGNLKFISLELVA